MGFKGSTKGSGSKKVAQKHKNQVVYVHQKHSKLTKLISSLPIYGLCQRCTDVIKWRKQYGKYKPLTVPKKCVGCQKKNIKEAYHVLCQECSKDKRVCAKCQEKFPILSDPSEHKTDAELNKEEQEFQQKLKSLPERKRRTILRKLEKGEDVNMDNIEIDDDSDFGTDSEDDQEEEEEDEDEEE